MKANWDKIRRISLLFLLVFSFTLGILLLKVRVVPSRWDFGWLQFADWLENEWQFLVTVVTVIGVAPVALRVLRAYLHGSDLPPDSTSLTGGLKERIWRVVGIVSNKPGNFWPALGCLVVACMLFGGLVLRIENSRNWEVIAPIGITISPDGRFVFVADTNGDTRKVRFYERIHYNGLLDGYGPFEVGNCTVNGEPQGIAVMPTGKEVFVVTKDPNTLTVLEYDSREIKIQKIIPLKDWPKWVTITPDGSKAYVSVQGPDFLTPDTKRFINVIDTENYKVIKDIYMPPISLALAPLLGSLFPEGSGITGDGRFLYVTTQNGAFHDPILVIDTETDELVSEREIPDMAVGIGMAVAPDGNTVYVARGATDSTDTAKLSVVNTRLRNGNKVTRNISLPVGPIALSRHGRYLVVGSSPYICIFDTEFIEKDPVKVDVGSKWGIQGIAIANDGKVYVNLSANKQSESNVFVYDLNELTTPFVP